MDIKLIKEWLSTAEGLLKSAIYLGGLIWLWAERFNNWLPAWARPWSVPALVGIAVIAAGLLLWPGFRRFAKASRLERPDAFLLNPTGPDGLIGRADDLVQLRACVEQFRLVLLSGESGAGKSALISAGLMVRLREGSGLLPVLVRDWGEDWVRGPFVAALDSLFHSVSKQDLDRLGWTSSPDLADTTPRLAADLQARMDQIFGTLGRRVLLIADQFDDYQAQHRNRFLDADANWLTPAALEAANPFWKLVSDGLRLGRLHLLAVTRSDTAAGLSSVRFLGQDQTRERPLDRVKLVYLHELLTAIAPGDSSPPVISHPEEGWRQLVEVLERDLSVKGAILMQQVRTLLLGLRQLPLITTRLYRAAGGLHGVESLFISGALRTAGEVAGGGDEGLRFARTVLGELVLPGGPQQPPKSRRVLFSQISTAAQNGPRTEAVLAALQQEDVVRPAEAAGGRAWQLDHDYLAGAVLAEARQANRLSIALREGMAEFRETSGNFRKRWRALLPMGTLLRLLWERARGRVRFGEARAYVLSSARKPALALLCLSIVAGIAYTVDQYQQVTAKADGFIKLFDTDQEANAVMEVWRAPEPVRLRIYHLLQRDEGRVSRPLDSAVRSRWPLAHAGVEPGRVQEAAALVRASLQRPGNDSRTLAILGANYHALVARMTAAEALRIEANALRAALNQKRGDQIDQSLVMAYAQVAQQLSEPGDLPIAAETLRAWLGTPGGEAFRSTLREAYAAIVQRLRDPQVVAAEAAALGKRLIANPTSETEKMDIAAGYIALPTQGTKAEDVARLAKALRAALKHETNDSRQVDIERAYEILSGQLQDQAISDEAEELGSLLDRQRDALAVGRATGGVLSTARAYVAVASRLTKPENVKELVARLDDWLARDGMVAGILAQGIVAAMTRQDYATDLKSLVETLRERLMHANSDNAYNLSIAYAAVVTRLRDPGDLSVEAAALQQRLRQEDNDEFATCIAHAYAAVAMTSNSNAERKQAAAIIGGRLQKEGGGPGSIRYVRPYAAVVARLDDEEVIEQALAVLFPEMNDSFPYTLNEYVEAFSMLAERLSDGVFVKAKTKTLRGLLLLDDYGRAPFIARFYQAMVTQLNDPESLKAEVGALRGHLEKAPATTIRWVAEAYTAVAKRLPDPDDLKHELVILHRLLEQARDVGRAEALAHAYAAVAAGLDKRRDLEDKALQSLSLAGHPFISDPNILITPFQPALGADFRNLGTALNWAERKGLRREQLRCKVAAKC
jgi:hypothetical protein